MTSIVFLENFFKNVVEKPRIVMKICVFGALLACPAVMTAEEEGPMQGLKIESKTHKYSADYHIAKEEGQNPDEDEDKKRTCVGMGEKVTLTLTGKKRSLEKMRTSGGAWRTGRIWAALRE